MHIGPEWSAWYGFCWSVSWTALTVGCSMRTEGSRWMPRRGPALVIANHQSYFDPVLVGVAVRRQICFLARKTLFTGGWLDRLIRSLNAFPVDHHGIATEGLRTVLQLLEAGRP